MSERTPLPQILFIAAWALIHAGFLFSQIVTEEMSKDLQMTYGYLNAHNSVVDYAIRECPDLAPQLKQAQSKFDSTFGVAEEKINIELQEILKDDYAVMVASSNENLQQAVRAKPVDQQSVQGYINEITKRAQGEIPSPVLETLLFYQFKDRPAAEMLAGFSKVFRTSGHAKSKGIDLQIEIPKSWNAREGKRPNVIQFFESFNGHGSVSALIMVRDFLDEVDLTPEETEALQTREGASELALVAFSDDALKVMLQGTGGTNLRNLNTTRLILEQWPAAMVEGTSESKRLDVVLTNHTRMYLVIYKNFLITLQCFIYKLPSENEIDLNAKVKKYDQLMDLIANSLVIHSQY